MVRMIDDLLDVSRITQGKINLRIETIDLGAVLKEALEASAEERHQLAQSLAVSLPDKPVWIQGDAVRVGQIIVNLVANASKFNRKDGEISVALGVEDAKTDGGSDRPAAVLRVRDNGVGIDPSLLPRIFDLFVQSDDAPGEPRTHTGIGVGLTLARRLVELHGGAIEASSAGLGKGSEFVVRLPVTTGPAQEKPPARAKTGRKATVTNPAYRILIVDDDADATDAMRLLLQREGHEVEVVSNGDDAKAHALRFRPDAVVLDLGLPGKNGFAVAKDLRHDGALSDVVIIAVSGYGDERHKNMSIEAGIDEHMTKPADLNRLLRRIAQGRKPGTS